MRPEVQLLQRELQKKLDIEGEPKPLIVKR